MGAASTAGSVPTRCGEGTAAAAELGQGRGGGSRGDSTLSGGLGSFPPAQTRPTCVSPDHDAPVKTAKFAFLSRAEPFPRYSLPSVLTPAHRFLTSAYNISLFPRSPKIPEPAFSPLK